MENASQALYMAAGVLIALLVISVGVFLIRESSQVSEAYEKSVNKIEFQKLNSRFSGYDKKSYYGKKIKDSEGNDTIIKITDHDVNENSVCVDYNTITDVVTAINQAYDINYKNNFDIQSSIQVTVNLDGVNYGITPAVQNANLKASVKDRGIIYKISDPNNKTTMEAVTNLSDTSNYKRLNYLLENYSDTVVDENKNNVYKFIFDGEVHYNSDSGVIDIVSFTKKSNLVYTALGGE